MNRRAEGYPGPSRIVQLLADREPDRPATANPSFARSCWARPWISIRGQVFAGCARASRVHGSRSASQVRKSCAGSGWLVRNPARRCHDKPRNSAGICSSSPAESQADKEGQQARRRATVRRSWREQDHLGVDDNRRGCNRNRLQYEKISLRPWGTYPLRPDRVQAYRAQEPQARRRDPVHKLLQLIRFLG